MNIFRDQRDQAQDRHLNPRDRGKNEAPNARLPYFDDAAAELPDSQKIDLPPGKYKVTLKVDGGAAQKREFEVAANETWGLLVGPDGAPLPVRLY